MMSNLRRRILFWVAFAAFAVVVGWAGRFHLFGAGYFRPVLITEKQIFDLGHVPPGSLTEVEFSVMNGGVRPLRIVSVRTGCAGCVEIVSYPSEPIRRNQSALIRVALNTQSLKGNVRKSILIISNDPVRRVYHILIDAIVEQKQEEAVGNDS